MTKVSINGKDAWLAIDTGAGKSVINSRKIDYLNLKASKGDEDVRGLGGKAHVMQNVTVPSMSIGGTKYIDPYFIALDLKHMELAGGEKGLYGLLGTEFLIRHEAIIDYGSRNILLKFPPKKDTEETTGE